MKPIRATIARHGGTGRAYCQIEFKEGPDGIISSEQLRLHVERDDGIFLGPSYSDLVSVTVPADVREGRDEITLDGFVKHQSIDDIVKVFLAAYELDEYIDGEEIWSA